MFVYDTHREVPRQETPSWQVPSKRNYGAMRIAQRHPTLFQRVFRKVFGL